MKLNLGCGNDYRKGFINVDNSPLVKTDVEWDLDKYPLPFKDKSVDYILCLATMENITDIIRFMEEIHRILKPKGKFRFRKAMAYTYVDGVDPQHKRHFIPNTFKLFLKGFKCTNLTNVRFKGKIWVTIPFFHKIRFPKQLCHLNSLVNNLFTGIEGELIKPK